MAGHSDNVSHHQLAGWMRGAAYAVVIVVPLLVQQSGGWQAATKTFDRNDPRYDFSDPRTIVLKSDPAQVWLTSMSHLRLARSVRCVCQQVIQGAFRAARPQGCDHMHDLSHHRLRSPATSRAVS